MDIIKSIEHEQLKNKIPDLKVGNTVRVHQRIKEGNREVTSDNDFYEDYGFVNMQPVVYAYRDGNEI